ncbi:MAG: hypothetical protein IJ220_05590 [Clostridia bacterium]|nr:hypothetical protein [Clostridia bacterium]
MEKKNKQFCIAISSKICYIKNAFYGNLMLLKSKAVIPAIKLGLKKAVIPANKLGLEKAVIPAIKLE